MKKREYRKWNTEVRMQTVDGREKIVGYAAVFNQLSEPMLMGNRTFRERVMPGAFDKCLASNPDIRGLFNHDPSLVLGRTKSGTMRISADWRGVRYVIDPPNTSYSDDLRESMRRGDVDQSSFGFYTVSDKWVQDGDGGVIRELQEVKLFDVSPVTFPAYNEATSGVEEMRALFPDGVPESISGHAPDLERRKARLANMKRRIRLHELASDSASSKARSTASSARWARLANMKRRIRLHELGI